MLRFLLTAFHVQLAGKPIEYPPEAVVSHDEVLTVGRQKADLMRTLVETVVGMI